MKANRWLNVSACCVGLACLLAASAIAERAWANSSSFSWRMDKVQIDGDKNGRFHALEAGELTIQGHIEITERMRASASTPLPMKFDLFRVDLVVPVCTVIVDPDRAVGTKKAFSASCGRIPGGTYWLRIIKVKGGKPDGDAWHNRGTGTFTTQ